MTWETILKADSQNTWIPYVVDIFRNSPERTMTAKTVVDNLIDNSTLSGSGKNQTKLKYKHIPSQYKIYAFLMKDDRFRTIEKRKANEFIWNGDEEE